MTAGGPGDEPDRDPEDFRDADDRERWLTDNVPPHHS